MIQPVLSDQLLLHFRVELFVLPHQMVGHPLGNMVQSSETISGTLTTVGIPLLVPTGSGVDFP